LETCHNIDKQLTPGQTITSTIIGFKYYVNPKKGYSLQLSDKL